MIQRPTAILLDLDDTLYDYKVAHSAGLTAAIDLLASRLNVRNQDLGESFRRSREEIHSQLSQTAASHSKLLQFKKTLEHIGIPGRIDLALEVESSYWGNFFRAMEATESSREFLEKARETGVPVFVTTDMTLRSQLQKLLILSLSGFISAVITSEETGCDKPSVTFLEQLQLRFKCDLTEIWVVGDDPVKDGMLAELARGHFFRVPRIESRGRFFRSLAKKLAQT